MLERWLRGFLADCRRMSVPVACLRAGRTASRTGRRERDELLDNRALRLHVESVDPDDPFFYASHRHYLARDLTDRQRVALARHHYDHEVGAFDAEYLDAAYSERGLTLWHERRKDTDFELRLVVGADVLYEGGMSVVFLVGGEKVAVVSYSHVERDVVFGPDDALRGRTTMFVTRKQLTRNYAYQRVFHAAFHRCTAAHFCLAALTGIARAQGFSSLAAIRAQAHPSFSTEGRERFEAAYDRYWESVGGQTRGRLAYEVPVPMALSPLEAMSSKARRRAVRRRAHLERIVECSAEAIRGHLRPSPSRASAVRLAGARPDGARGAAVQWSTEPGLAGI